MRETYSTLLQTTKDLCVDENTDSTTSLSPPESFMARRINETIQYLHSLIKNFKTQPLPRTMNTVANQIYYHYPPGLLSLESVTMSVGSINYPLKVVSSQAKWDKLQQLDVTSSDIPQYYFPRQSDFGIYPTPSAVKTVTIIGNFLPQRISVGDYTTETVSVSQNSRTVTGSSTVFTSAMVGRWFCEADSNGLSVGNWYRISGYTSATSLTLESVFEEASLSGSKYIIAQSPELPEELHEYIPYRAAAAYYSGPRRDAQRGQELLNYFFTGDYVNPRRGGGIQGGVLGIINGYKNKGRGNSQLIQKHQGDFNQWRNEAWATTLSEAS